MLVKPPQEARHTAMRSRGRRLALAGTTLAATAVGLAAMTVSAGSASADTLVNGPTIHLGQYAVPGHAPAYVDGGDVLPQIEGTLGNPSSIFMTGSSAVLTANTQVVEVPNGSTTWGVQAATNVSNGGSAQSWFFQRVGWVGVETPSVSDPTKLGVPVYKIINFKPGGSRTCLEGMGANPDAGQRWTRTAATRTR